ncbi:FAD-dependent monooxygenase [Fodinicola acaciae]|uniref:FAD-dependent monooxygenase n=1 Tax=Fodinicola acaciae TaxID=2681555 RepID=UPI0013D77F72|nr:FAD-dependent monooxygenase [Fodinicola acaciae]
MTTNVLIAGAGPTGLTLGIELARRGVDVRIVDRAERYFVGSRGDGLQPRTQEVFEDLGVLAEIQASGMDAPLMRMYAGEQVVWEGRMADPVEPRPDVPYPNGWFVPQARTEEILRDRLAELGVRVELRTAVTGFEQDADGVTVRLERDGETEVVRAAYLVGADGGRSTVRKQLGIPFVGETNEEIRMTLADVRATGLDHRYGHGWMLEGEKFFGFTPLATGPDTYVIATTGDVELTLDSLQKQVDAISGRTDIILSDLTWATVWRPNIRMVERFRDGRVFLAGDAAHVHPPTGGQGLNTGVQDAYNLGWKLAAVLGGAPEELLETYQAERLPVAARVLGVSTELLQKYIDGDEDANKRGDNTKGLDISYRTVPGDGLAAGDRAPDGLVGERRLFELFAGPHWTLLRFGAGAPEADGVESYEVDAVDGYDVPAGSAVLVRPDGYVGLVTSSGAELAGYLRRVSPAPKMSYPGRTVDA